MKASSVSKVMISTTVDCSPKPSVHLGEWRRLEQQRQLRLARRGSNLRSALHEQTTIACTSQAERRTGGGRRKPDRAWETGEFVSGAPVIRALALRDRQSPCDATRTAGQSGRGCPALSGAFVFVLRLWMPLICPRLATRALARNVTFCCVSAALPPLFLGDLTAFAMGLVLCSAPPTAILTAVLEAIAEKKKLESRSSTSSD